MMKTIPAVVALVWAAGAALAADASTQPARSAAEAHRRLFTRYAARADAVRKLAARLADLKITPQVTVRDFAADANGVGMALEAFLSGLQETSEPNYAPDGTCVVHLAVGVEAAAAALRHIHERGHTDPRVQGTDFLTMASLSDANALKATGAAGMPAAFGGDRWATRKADARFGPPPGAATFWKAHCSPTAARAAERAARLDALARLARRIELVHVAPDSTLRGFLAASDDPNVDLRTFLKGARRRAVRYHVAAPIVETDLEIELRAIYAALRSWGRRHFKGDRAKVEHLEKLAIRAADRRLLETGVAVPPDAEIKDPTPEIRRIAALARAMPAWVSRSLKGTGKGANRAAAELAARIDLAERIYRLPVGAARTVGSLAAGNDDLKTAVRICQQAARVRTERKPAAEANVLATAEIELRDLWHAVLHCRRKAPAGGT